MNATQTAKKNLSQIIKSSEDLKIFNGTFTIISPRGGHKTFRIESILDSKSSFFSGKRVIAIMDGRNNETDYKKFGFVDNQGIRVWNRYDLANMSLFDQRKFEVEDQLSGDFEFLQDLRKNAVLYAKMVWQLSTNPDNQFVKLGYKLELSGECVFCGKTLTNPKSMRTGIGPECAKKYLAG